MCKWKYYTNKPQYLTSELVSFSYVDKYIVGIRCVVCKRNNFSLNNNLFE